MASPEAIAYVYHGEDEPTLKEQLDAYCASLFADPTSADLNTTRLDGKTLQLGEIEQAAGTLPFLAEVRLALVDNLTESASGKDIIDELTDLLPRLPDSARLLFVETGLKNFNQDSQGDQKRKAGRRAALKKLINIIENNSRGKVLSFDPPRDTAAWIVDRAARHEAAIERSAARLLAERINENLRLADSELAKLAIYTNGERAISEDDVRLLTPYSPEANIFHMVDALGQRDGQRALTLLARLLDEGDEPIRIFGMIARQYRLLIMVKEHLDAGGSDASAARVLGLRDFIARKLVGQARIYPLDALERVYRHLFDLDLAIKTGQMDPVLAIESFIARLAR